MSEKAIEKNRFKPSVSLRKELVESELLMGPNKKYVRSQDYKVETYGFYIRIIHEHFYLCEKCQLEIKEILETSDIYYHKDRTHVSLTQKVTNKKRVFSFDLHFITPAIFPFTWKPCTRLTIGNKDYLEPVELWRKFQNKDDWKTVEERPSTPEEQERLAKSWFD
jgi:hypothetical protein